MTLGPPQGFETVARDGGTLFVAPGRRDALQRVGLDTPAGWTALTRADHVPGRGVTGTVEVGDGARWRWKQMRRGGFGRFVWRDRFLGRARLMQNLLVPAEAVRRGVPTPEPIALALLPGPAGLYRGWLVVAEIPDALDLVRRFRSTAPPDAAALARVATMIRAMHDSGLEHRDLNLGNLLLQPVAGADEKPWVIDLDKARLHPGPLPIRLRQRALRRLERSGVKLFGSEGPVAGDLRAAWYEAYAAGDAELTAALTRARRRNRFWLFVHRLGWRA